VTGNGKIITFATMFRSVKIRMHNVIVLPIIPRTLVSRYKNVRAFVYTHYLDVITFRDAPICV